MKKKTGFFAGLIAVFLVVPAMAAVPFVYDTWNGIPQGKVRLKAYCKKDSGGNWILNAVSNPRDGKPSLSITAREYLNVIQVPDGACTPDSSIGSAFWIPTTDQIIPDDPYKDPRKTSLAPAAASVSTSSIAAQYIVRGESSRTKLVATYLQSRGHSVVTEGDVVTGTLKGKVWPGVQVVAESAGAIEGVFVPVSDKAVRTGTLCDGQQDQLDGLRRLNTAASTGGVSRAEAACLTGNCNPRNPQGAYTTLNMVDGIRVVANYGHPSFPMSNMVTFKLEYHNDGLHGWPYGTGWGPTIVVRNANTDIPSLIARHKSRIIPYLHAVLALKKGQAGAEGESCYEVALFENGGVFKNDSPPEYPWR